MHSNACLQVSEIYNFTYFLSEDCNPLPNIPGKHMTFSTNHLIPEV